MIRGAAAAYGIGALGSRVWLFVAGATVAQGSDGTLAFALLSASAIAPGIAVSILGGSFVDRFGGRATLRASSALRCFVTLLALATTLVASELTTIAAVAATILFAGCDTLEWLAAQAHTRRTATSAATGQIEFVEAIGIVLGPAIGSALLVGWGARVVLGALSMLFFAANVVAWRDLTSDAGAAPAVRPRWREQVRDGWRQLLGDAFLLRFFIAFTVATALINVIMTLRTPYLIELGGAEMAGFGGTLYGFGALLGGVLAARLNLPSSSTLVMGLMAAAGLCSASVALSTTPWVLCIGCGGVGFMLVLVNSVANALWRERTLAGAIGQVFAVRRVVIWSAVLIAQVASGLLGERFARASALPPGTVLSAVQFGLALALTVFAVWSACSFRTSGRVQIWPLHLYLFGLVTGGTLFAASSLPKTQHAAAGSRVLRGLPAIYAEDAALDAVICLGIPVEDLEPRFARPATMERDEPCGLRQASLGLTNRLAANRHPVGRAIPQNDPGRL